jgi:hypothetical protein
LREQAAAAAANVEILSEAAIRREQWYDREITTQGNADAARAELHTRGVEPDHEPDRVTTEEWLAAEADARQTDDEHRPITENDLRDPILETAAGWRVPDPRSPELAAELPKPEPIAELDQTGQAPTPGLQAGRKQRANNAHTSLGPSLAVRQIEALVATSSLAAALAADQISQEDTHNAYEAEHRVIDSLAAGRRRRDATDLDHAIATGTALGDDHGAGMDSGRDVGAEYGIDDDKGQGAEIEL